ncbi:MULTISPECIES: AI-2E family transporter [Galbibacter]|uniref:AI-2E family transporter n=1 Tax=Galbibacter pacificus TaxID=2996052 RepID=A0ABT6FP93_9FLAO|nr:AI-2E family transporter [Galbibacter pacificus]MDG3581609.1 AI-2E family transporter [Galbibacter pacificus]MDG3585087.1 AI-2E family transporter [Galbibacter pacificus]
MDSKTIANGILRAIATIVGILLLLFFLYKIQAVIAYIIIAVVISLIGRPLVRFLIKRCKFNNNVAVIITMMVMIILLVGIVSLFIPLIIEQGKNLSLLNIENLRMSLQDVYRELSDYFSVSRYEVEASIEESLKKSDFISTIDLSAIPNMFNYIIGGLGSITVALFTIIFISFFFLKDRRLFQNGLLTFIPPSNEQRVINSLESIKNLLSRYFIGLLLQIAILFVIYTIVLLVFGIQNAIVIAFLCALLNLVPYVGPLIGGILMVSLTMSSNLGADFSTVILPKAIYVLIGFIIGQLVDNFFSQPLIFSSSVKSHPLEIFLVIIIAGMVFGVFGMVLAVPAYTAIKVVLKEFLSENNIVSKLTKNL